MADTFEILKKAADGIAMQFGPNTEVVIHDFRDDINHTVRYIVNGHVTGRKIGDGPRRQFLKDLELSKLDETHNRQISTTADGRTIRSTTANYLDEDGSLEFAMCINQDITDIMSLEKAVASMSESRYFESAPLDPESGNGNENINTSIHDLMEQLISEGIRQIGAAPDQMNKNQKIDLIRFLDARGIFQIQKSGAELCELLGISKFTFYNYLEEARNR
ncbi:MAG: helix-turn-helix transcriptional regulator [Anaerovoracaceae bacterium]|nr:helix-turn-helix transcriptional regulator [Anaerovoracaceae bacterium]